jgi:hypothetical protein
MAGMLALKGETRKGGIRADEKMEDVAVCVLAEEAV